MSHSCAVAHKRRAKEVNSIQCRIDHRGTTSTSKLDPFYTNYHCTMSESFTERCNSTVLSSRGLPSAKDQVTCQKSRSVQHQGIAAKTMYPKSVFPAGKNSSACVMKHLADLKVELVNKELWKMFHSEGHEMKITNTGRYVIFSYFLRNQMSIFQEFIAF